MVATLRLLGRRAVLGVVASLAATLALAAPGLAGAEDRVGSRDVTLGNPQAPVTVIEYGSITCPHCARFNAGVLPQLKAKYIVPGKVQYVFREVPINEQEDTAGFLIARCAGPDRYLAVVDALMRGQSILFEKHNLHDWLMAGASAGGLNEAQMKTCISDPAAIEAFNARAEHTVRVDKIDSTPTIIVNGAVVKARSGTHEFGMADLDAALTAAFRRAECTARGFIHRARDPLDPFVGPAMGRSIVLRGPVESRVKSDRPSTGL